jgi:hypothetical protein
VAAVIGSFGPPVVTVLSVGQSTALDVSVSFCIFKQLDSFSRCCTLIYSKNLKSLSIPVLVSFPEFFSVSINGAQTTINTKLKHSTLHFSSSNKTKAKTELLFELIYIYITYIYICFIYIYMLYIYIYKISFYVKRN